MISLKNKIAIVTGASRSTGIETATSCRCSLWDESDCRMMKLKRDNKNLYSQ